LSALHPGSIGNAGIVAVADSIASWQHRLSRHCLGDSIASWQHRLSRHDHEDRMTQKAASAEPA
jgi:hypothetical protein